MTDRTPTNDNATSGLVAELREDATLVQNMLGMRAADTITTLQARVAEVEAQLSVSVGHRKAQALVIDRLRAERDEARARVAEAKAEGMRDAVVMVREEERRQLWDSRHPGNDEATRKRAGTAWASLGQVTQQIEEAIAALTAAPDTARQEEQK